MARAGLNRKSALATTTLVLAAEAPDIDTLSELHGHLSGFEHHRGITHSFVGVPLVAAALVFGLYLWYQWFGRRYWHPEKPPRWGVLFGLACLSGLSHILLDFTNNYGVRPFWPFSPRWYSWDIVFIAEPVLWAILLAGLLLPSLIGMARHKAGAHRRARMPWKRTSAIAALVLVAGFWAFRDHQHRRALAAMRTLAYGGETPVRVSAYPYYVNPFRWYGVVETRDFYDSLIVNSRIPEVNPDGHAIIRFRPEPTPAILAARQSVLGQVFFDWAQYPLAETERLHQPTPGYLVHFYDVRFFYPEFSGRRTLGGWVQLDPNFNVVAQDFGWRRP
jgi:inner membrane protein